MFRRYIVLGNDYMTFVSFGPGGLQRGTSLPSVRVLQGWLCWSYENTGCAWTSSRRFLLEQCRHAHGLSLPETTRASSTAVGQWASSIQQWMKNTTASDDDLLEDGEEDPGQRQRHCGGGDVSLPSITI